MVLFFTVGFARCPTWMPFTWLPSITLASSVTRELSPTMAPHPLVSSTLFARNTVRASPPAQMHASPALSNLHAVTTPLVRPLTCTLSEAHWPSTQLSTCGAASSAMPMPMMASLTAHDVTVGCAFERISMPRAFGHVISKFEILALLCLVTAMQETITGFSLSFSSLCARSTPVKSRVMSRTVAFGLDTFSKGPFGISEASPTILTSPRSTPLPSRSATSDKSSWLSRTDAVCLYSPGESMIVVPFGTAFAIFGRLAPGNTFRVLVLTH
mmetsp:Transcript_12559/g.24362  ORF Transcript_12559/g.24362 Transcript_12559/m.24362 type:complete len:270 (-) Transcript_12559:545-1354(-)